MVMAALINYLFLLFLFFFFPCLFANHNSLSCDNNDANNPFSGYNVCNKTETSQHSCNTYAVLLTNPHYSSLFNLSFYLGLNRNTIAEANGFSPDVEFLPLDQPLLIPINCKCGEAGFFEAEITKNAVAGESFNGIAESLEGLTTCWAVRDRNIDFPPWNLREKTKVSVPLKCACPNSSDISSGTNLLVSYPISKGITLSSLATQLSVSPESILRANNLKDKREVDSLLSILVPLSQKPQFGSFEKPSEPSSIGFPEKKRRKMSKMRKLIACVVSVSVAMLAAIVAVSAFLIMKQKRNQQRSICVPGNKLVDVELQQLSLSVRTTSEKKVSFEGSQSTTFDGEATTPRNICKAMLENYTLEELKKATEDFDSHCLIEGSVYHGRVKGKNVAIKQTTSDFLSKVDFSLFQDTIHNHPNIMRVVGSCVTDGPDSYLVFEYAKNGSLKDWIHGGLAMKSHFIASCYCFLTWRQRLRVCLDVALALQYMHHIMHPVYTHGNIRSRNIFLDEEFNAKLGNFGMSRCAECGPEDGDDDKFNKGYFAPEYVKQGVISPSIDVFAFGVVLLEVLSGEMPVMEKEDESVMLSEKIKVVLESVDAEGKLREWIDSDLGENYPLDSAAALASLARSCVEDEPSMRPSAGEIVEKLSRLVEETHGGDQQFLMSESSCKPLVQSVSNNNMR